MRRLTSVTALSILGALGALLAGCPMWGPDNGPDRGRDGGVVFVDGDTGQCDTSSDCRSGEYCNVADHRCVVSQPCTDNAACASLGAYYCDDRNSCVPGCASNAECTALGAGLSCDTSTHRCRQTGCSSDAQCGSGRACVGGSCRDAADVCRFDYQCAGGQSCVDGRCVAGCSSTRPCANSAQVCTNGYCQDPPANPACTCADPTKVCDARNVCRTACTSSTACGTGNFCDNGVCRPDDRRPEPFCTASSGCAAGSVCIDGVCRISCAGGNSETCQRRDVNFNLCDSQFICRYSSEVSPECARNADCSGGKVCVNALCR